MKLMFTASQLDIYVIFFSRQQTHELLNNSFVELLWSLNNFKQKHAAIRQVQHC